MTTKVEKSIEVNLPVSTVYNQWTQFAEFPHFMNGITSITQLGGDRMLWVAEIGGIRRQWEAKVLEQVPDRKVAWAATEGATNAGSVSFTDLGDRTRVELYLEYEPEGLVEKVGDKLNVVENQAEGDLDRFKAFIESEGYATGAWRGTVPAAGHVGTPGVEHAAGSRGDDGHAGVSGKAVATGIGVATAAAVGIAAVAAAGTKKKEQESPAAATTPLEVTPATSPGEPISTSFDATESPVAQATPAPQTTPVPQTDPAYTDPVGTGEIGRLDEGVYGTDGGTPPAR